MKVKCRNCEHIYKAQGKSLKEGHSNCPKCNAKNMLFSRNNNKGATNATCPHIAYCYMREYCKTQRASTCNWCGVQTDVISSMKEDTDGEM